MRRNHHHTGLLDWDGCMLWNACIPAPRGLALVTHCPCHIHLPYPSSESSFVLHPGHCVAIQETAVMASMADGNDISIMGQNNNLGRTCLYPRYQYSLCTGMHTMHSWSSYSCDRHLVHFRISSLSVYSSNRLPSTPSSLHLSPREYLHISANRRRYLSPPPGTSSE